MGSESLAGKVAVVAGGAGTVGSAIVKAFLAEGATVVVPSREQKRLDDLATELGNPSSLLTVVADVGSETGVQAVIEFIDKNLGGKIDHVASSLGSGIWGTPVLGGGKDLKFLQKAFDDICGNHYVVALGFLEKLADKAGSSFTFISGTLGGFYLPGAGFTSIGAGAQWGLSIVLRAETAEKAVRVNDVRIGMPMTRNDSISTQIGELTVAVAASSTKGEVILVREEAEIPGLKEKYSA